MVRPTQWIDTYEAGEVQMLSEKAQYKIEARFQDSRKSYILQYHNITNFILLVKSSGCVCDCILCQSSNSTAQLQLVSGFIAPNYFAFSEAVFRVARLRPRIDIAGSLATTRIGLLETIHVDHR